MEFQSVGRNPAQSLQELLSKRSVEREERLRGGREAGGAPARPAEADAVRLGQSVEGLRPESLLAERVRARVESETGLRTESRTAAPPPPRGETAQAAPSPAGGLPSNDGPGIEPRASARQIVTELAEGIFPAFEASRPGADAEALEGLRGQVLEGLRSGVEDARDIFRGLGVLDAGLEEALSETERLARGGIEDFFAERAGAALN